MNERRIVLSGAISGHIDEAKVYFEEARKAVMERYPTAQVFNPMDLPKLPSWEGYMKICRMRVGGWATDIVRIMNEYYHASNGAAEERELAESKHLQQHVFAGGLLTELPSGVGHE